jgi:hypothetical protein
MSELKTVSSEELRCVHGGRDEHPPPEMATPTGSRPGPGGKLLGPTGVVLEFDDLEDLYFGPDDK